MNTTVVFQTTEAVVPGSNSAFLAVENSEDRQARSLPVYAVSAERDGPAQINVHCTYCVTKATPHVKKAIVYS